MSSFSISLDQSASPKVTLNSSDQGMKYQLKSVISLINDEEGCFSAVHPPVTQHLVLHSLLQQQQEKPAEWYLFNDYSICNSSEQDALSFTQSWKTPICFVFENTDYDSEVIPSILSASQRPAQPFYSLTSLGAPNMY